MEANQNLRPARAFTLVELLVVIGIIAVLIAILMPALSRAQHAARSVGCQANLRSIMQAVFAYANDNNGDLVPANWLNSATPPPYGTNPHFWEAPACDAILLGRYTDGPNCTNSYGYIRTRNSVWNCPEKDWGNAPSSFQNSSTNFLTSYAMNQGINTCPVIAVNATDPPGSTGWEHEYKLSSVRSPTRMLCFVCSSTERFTPYGNYFGNPDGFYNSYNSGSPGCAYNLALRHPNHSTNIAFMDGHVENIAASLYTVGGNTGYSLYPALQRHDFVVSPDAAY